MIKLTISKSVITDKIMADMPEHRRQMWLAGAPTVAPAALPDYTNGHEKGYENVRVSQGKPLTAGNTARLLLRGYSATVASEPEQCKCPQMELFKGLRVKKETQDKMMTDNMALSWLCRLWQTVPLSRLHSGHSGHGEWREQIPHPTVLTHANIWYYFRRKWFGESCLNLKYLHQENNYKSNYSILKLSLY